MDKTNKPESFAQLYRRANPSPGARAKVPLLHVVASSPEEEEEEEETEDDTVLCESTVIVEFLADMDFDDDARIQEKQAAFWPPCPKKRATMRLFVELCGHKFDSSYLAFSRVSDMAQVQAQYLQLQKDMKQVDAFLSYHYPEKFEERGTALTLPEVHVAPFVQLCCGILPPPYDPMSIAKDLHLDNLQAWMERILQRESVVSTAAQLNLQTRQDKLVKRLARIQAKEEEEASF
eukprot:scaffold1555_cov173-Amphora_coffeaeformis.AAC.1